VSGVTLAWLTALGIETWRYETTAGNPKLPPPALYAKSALAFLILGLVAQAAPKPAQLFAWGIVIAAVVNENLLAPANLGAGSTAQGSKTPPASGTSVAANSSTNRKAANR
jgi:hypothetical protein